MTAPPGVVQCRAFAESERKFVIHPELGIRAHLLVLDEPERWVWVCEDDDELRAVTMLLGRGGIAFESRPTEGAQSQIEVTGPSAVRARTLEERLSRVWANKENSEIVQQEARWVRLRSTGVRILFGVIAVILGAIECGLSP